MRMRLWAAAFAALALAGSARAQAITLRFGTNGLPAAVPGSLALTATAGQTATFQVFLTDADVFLRPTAQGGTGNGLQGVGTGVLSSSPANADFLGTGTSDVVPNSAEFTLSQVVHVNDSTIGSPGRASAEDVTFFGTPVHQQVPSPGVPTVATPDYVLIGTFTIHAPLTAPGGVVTLSLFNWSPATSNNTSFNGVGLDGLAGMYADTAHLTVIPVPEPSALALVGLAGVGLIRRRRKAPAAV
ncbi:MAG TPA: PEP-CTERM sorting domain-containing protein [Gemmataceae bacterium]|jgi:hypothetical protein